MSNARKGGCVAAVAIVAIAMMWALCAGDEPGDCVRPDSSWIDGCQCDSFPSTGILAYGIIFGIPVAVVVGALVGAFAGRLERWRKLVFVSFGVASAIACLAIEWLLMTCSSDPTVETLWLRTLVPSVVAALVLEVWTRQPPIIPRAITSSRGS